MTLADLLCLSLLLTQLESPRFTERDRAMRNLDAMGQRAVPAMLAAKDGASRDARDRMAKLLAKRQKEREATAWAALIYRQAPLPWLDSCPDDCPDRCEMIHYFVWGGGRANHGQTQKDWTNYRNATAGWLIWMRDDGVRVEDAVRLIERMDRRCAKWNGAGMPPAEE